MFNHIIPQFFIINACNSIGACCVIEFLTLVDKPIGIGVVCAKVDFIIKPVRNC